jgi:hypothetical protein
MKAKRSTRCTDVSSPCWEARSRQHHDEEVVLRLDPLLLAGAQDGDGRLMPSLRREFGPEAHLSVTTSSQGVFVMAARAGRGNEVAAAIRRRLASLAPARLTGQRPGILSVFVEDAGRLEWRRLRNGLELEGEARQFMTSPEAQPVVAASFVSRLELFGLGGPDTAAGGELRFRNPRHPAAGSAALAPAVVSGQSGERKQQRLLTRFRAFSWAVIGFPQADPRIWALARHRGLHPIALAGTWCATLHGA